MLKMDTTQLLNIVRKDKYLKNNFCGVIPIDFLPKYAIKKRCSFIVNTDESSKPGTHWFGIYVIPNKHIEYFDSFGRKPSKPVIDFIIKNGGKYTYNKFSIQHNKSIYCGLYSLFYLFLRNRNYSLSQIQKFFMKNKNINEKFIFTFFKKYLNKRRISF